MREVRKQKTEVRIQKSGAGFLFSVFCPLSSVLCFLALWLVFSPSAAWAQKTVFKYDEVYLEYGGNLIYSGQTLYAPAGAPCTARVKVKNASDNEESFCVEMVNESLTSPKRLGGDPGGMLAGSSVKDIDISFDVPAEDAVIVFYTYWNKKNKGKVFEKQNDCRIFKYVKAEAEFVFDCGNNNCFITDFVSEYNKYSIITAHKSTSLYANVRIKNIGHAEGNYFFRVLAIYEDESEEPLGKSQRGTLAVSGARKITGIGASFDAPSADADIYFEVYWHDQDDYKKKHTYGPFEYKTLTLPAPAIIKPGLNNANPGAPEVISWKRDGLTGYVFDWEDIPAGHGVDKYKLSAYGLNGRYIGGIIIEGAPPVSEWVVPEDSAFNESAVYYWQLEAHNIDGWGDKSLPKYFKYVREE